MLLTTYHNMLSKAIEEAQSIDHIKPHLLKVTDVDDSPDLTDIHPRDREDMDMRFLSPLIHKDIFKLTSKLIEQDSNIIDALIIAFAPQTQLYEHVDTVELEPYAKIDWLSVYMPMFVPSIDSSKVGVKVGDIIYDHKETIIFDTQIPHSAWNWTDNWWVSLRLSVKKEII